MNSKIEIGKNEYKFSCFLYLIEACFSNFVNILASGAYLAKLTTTIGITDSTTALLSTFASFSGIFQLLSIMLAHKKPYKIWVTPFAFLMNIIIGSIYLLPFMKFGNSTMNFALFIIIGIGFAIRQIIMPIQFNWFLSLPDPKKRGMFQASLSIVSMIGMIIFQIFIGRMIDSYEAVGNIKGAFMNIFIFTLVCSFISFMCFLFSKEKPVTEEDNVNRHINIVNDIKAIVKNRVFISYTVVLILFGVCQAISSPFINTYLINELSFSMTYISTVGIVINVIKIIALIIFGKLSEKKDFTFMLRISYSLYFISFLIMTFTTPLHPSAVKPMYFLYNVFNIVGQTASTVAAVGIFKIVKEDQIVGAQAITAVIIGLLSFLTTLAVTPLFNYISVTKESHIFGKTFYAQQILFAISAIFIVFIILYLVFRFDRLYKKKEESDF